MEYLEPGRYRHGATFGGADYSQGPVELRRVDKVLVIRNMGRGEEVTYLSD